MVSLRVGLIVLVLGQCCWACSKVPVFNGRAVGKEKKPGDNGYRLAVRNEPSGYEPGKIYNCKCPNMLYLLCLGLSCNGLSKWIRTPATMCSNQERCWFNYWWVRKTQCNWFITDNYMCVWLSQLVICEHIKEHRSQSACVFCGGNAFCYGWWWNLFVSGSSDVFIFVFDW